MRLGVYCPRHVQCSGWPHGENDIKKKAKSNKMQGVREHSNRIKKQQEGIRLHKVIVNKVNTEQNLQG